MSEIANAEAPSGDIYRCAICGLEAPENETPETCPQCETMGQQYLIE